MLTLFTEWPVVALSAWVTMTGHLTFRSASIHFVQHTHSVAKCEYKHKEGTELQRSAAFFVLFIGQPWTFFSIYRILCMCALASTSCVFTNLL